MDIYNESQKLAEALSKCNNNPISQEILDAIDYGSTGTEILMKLKHCLDELLTTGNLHATSEISRLAKNILTEINQYIN